MPRTTKTNSSGGSRRLHAVSDTPVARRRSDAEDSLWVALYDQPHSTAAQLALAAGIGKSTAGKILAAWAKDATVTRTPGVAQGGRRVADRWVITEADHTTPDPDNTAERTPAEAVPDRVANSPTATAAHAEPGEPAPTDQPTDQTTDQTAEPTAAATPPVADNTDEPTNQPTPSSTADQTASIAATTASDASDVTGPMTPTVVTGKAARLGKGALRGMVEDFLTGHPGEQFSPNKIAKELDRSAGAVFNALEKLVTDGWAVRTNDAPKRYAANRDTAPESSANSATDTATSDRQPQPTQPVG